jgi:hypothetical protein
LAETVSRVISPRAGVNISLGSGINEIFVSDDTLVLDGTFLHGGLGVVGAESPWATGPDGTRYGINSEGQLGINAGLRHQQYRHRHPMLKKCKTDSNRCSRCHPIKGCLGVLKKRRIGWITRAHIPDRREGR